MEEPRVELDLPQGEEERAEAERVFPDHPAVEGLLVGALVVRLREALGEAAPRLEERQAVLADQSLAAHLEAAHFLAVLTGDLSEVVLCLGDLLAVHLGVHQAGLLEDHEGGHLEMIRVEGEEEEHLEVHQEVRLEVLGEEARVEVLLAMQQEEALGEVHQGELPEQLEDLARHAVDLEEDPVGLLEEDHLDQLAGHGVEAL